MKEVKCPLCGGNLEIVQVYRYESVESPGCLNCGYQILDKDAIESARRNAFPEGKMFPNDLKMAEEFVSKFPPLMRVSPGDKVIIGPNYVESITAVNKEGGYMKFGDGGHIAFPMDVAEWPWEIEQKEKK